MGGFSVFLVIMLIILNVPHISNIGVPIVEPCTLKVESAKRVPQTGCSGAKTTYKGTYLELKNLLALDSQIE